ncbi:MAG TPA: SCO family protein [Solirubrobacterales bacterium]|nr:SCO family protein [Solirubrobacterales bacterium]
MSKSAARRSALAMLGALIVAAALLSGCGGGGGGKATPRLDAAGEVQSTRPAPEISLRNWDGRPVRLARLRGRAVLLTFIYDHCPDTCPLIVSKLRQALVELGPKAAQAQVVAVSVDPRGDTPKTVRKFLVAHQMLGRMDYLIGSRRQLAPVWRAYGIDVGGSPEERENREGSGVAHTALVYGIAGSGRERALYDPLFKPSQVSHDVPLLASM